MSIGKRRPKPSRAQLRDFPSVSLQQSRLAPSAPPVRQSVAGRSDCAGDVGDRARLGPGVHVPAGPASRPRDPGQRQGIPNPQPDEDQQRAPGRLRPSAAVDGQRPRADQGPRWTARRPDGDHRQVPTLRGRGRHVDHHLEVEARDVSRRQGGDRHAPASRQLARPDRPGVRSSARRRRPRPGRPAPQRGDRRTLSIRNVDQPLDEARVFPASGSFPSGSSSPTVRSRKNSSPRSPRLGSARSCSNSSPSGSTADRR